MHHLPPHGFGGPGWGLLAGFFGTAGAVVAIMAAVIAVAAVAAFLLLVIRFLIVGTKAAELYLDEHRPSASPPA